MVEKNQYIDKSKYQVNFQKNQLCMEKVKRASFNTNLSLKTDKN